MSMDRRSFLSLVAKTGACTAAGVAIAACGLGSAAAAESPAPAFQPSPLRLAGYDRTWAYTPEEVAEFTNAQHVDDQIGFQFCFLADEDSVRKMLPPHFGFVAPFLMGYFVEMRRPGFGAPYMESCLAVLAEYNGVVGLHNLALYLHGPGSDCGPYLFGHNCPIPKKQADDITISRVGNQVNAKVIRHGVKIWDMDLEFGGEYNDEEMGLATLGDGTNIGVPMDSVGWYHPYEVIPNEDGTTTITDLKLAGLNISTTLSHIEKGKILKFETASTEDDTFGEIQMLAPFGASWQITSECIMGSSDIYADLDPAVSLPSLMRYYDVSLMGGKSTLLSV